MRLKRGRAKKLTLAFHFYRRNPAGWKCEQCRKSRLEARRRCGFVKTLQGNDSRIVWAGGGAMSTECPVSTISGQSIALLEEYAAWKVLGRGAVLRDLPAKVVDALQVLEAELKGENCNEN